MHALQIKTRGPMVLICWVWVDFNSTSPILDTQPNQFVATLMRTR